MENETILKFETLYGWRTSKKYQVPVEYQLFPVCECFERSVCRSNIPTKGRIVQEYDNMISKEDIIEFDSQLQDLAMKGVMVGRAPESIINEAQKYGIEIRLREKLRLKVLSNPRKAD
jgi:hypothetical protein